MKTTKLQDLTTVQPSNVLNLFAELYINVNDNELTFIKECLKNANELPFEVLKAKNEFKDNRDRELLLKALDRFLEFANLPFDVTVTINEIGCYIGIVYHSEKWQFEHHLAFKTFNRNDAFALFNLLTTGAYIIKEPFTKYA